MSLDEDELIEALERRQRPWTEHAVRELAQEPPDLKAQSELCAACEQPCRVNEVCATVAVDELDLRAEVGREQAFHLVESGMRRLQLRGGASLREEGEHRPNTFLTLE